MVIDGINTHINYNDINLVKKLGCKWVRVDFEWWNIETKDDHYSWSRVDSLINAYSSAGFTIYATLMGSPAWHRPSFKNPPDPAIWARFCRNVAKRYQHKIAVYSLWNEPNLSPKSFWSGGVKEFFDVIIVNGYNAIKGVNPSLQVAGADFATNHASDWTEWLSMMRKYSKYVDIVSIHSYKHTGEEVVRAFTKGKFPVLNWFIPTWRPYNQYLKKIGKPVILTEVGLEASYSSPKEMAKQSEFVKCVQSNVHKMGVQAAIFYCLLDDNSGVEGPFGFYTSDKKPKTVVLS